MELRVPAPSDSPGQLKLGLWRSRLIRLTKCPVSAGGGGQEGWEKTKTELGMKCAKFNEMFHERFL